MSIQDKLERILRELHIMVSRAPALEADGEIVLIQKKEAQRQLNALSQVVVEMMEQYEVTEEGRMRAELTAENARMEIMRNANLQAEDIYAASVLYTEDALGRIQEIIDQAEKSAKEILGQMNRDMEAEKRIVRANQVELITQLEDLNDTSKYLKLIEERNHEIAKEKAKKAEDGGKKGYRRKKPKEEGIAPIAVDVKVNEEYFEKEGVMKEDVSDDGDVELPKIQIEDVMDEEVTYEKPVIKINKEYFEKAGMTLEGEDDAQGDLEEIPLEEVKERRPGLFSFGRKP